MRYANYLGPREVIEIDLGPLQIQDELGRYWKVNEKALPRGDEQRYICTKKSYEEMVVTAEQIVNKYGYDRLSAIDEVLRLESFYKDQLDGHPVYMVRKDVFTWNSHQSDGTSNEPVVFVLA